MSIPANSPPLNRALKLAQQGQLAEAENEMIRHVGRAESEHGSYSRQFARAQYELGFLCWAVGKTRDAMVALQEAAEVDLDEDPNARHDRMTYLLQLGEVQEELGQLEQAERTFRLCYQLRLDFYGADHPEIAVVLDALSGVLLRLGRLEDALVIAEQAIDSLWVFAHPRVATTLLRYALISSKLKRRESTFGKLDDLPIEFVEDLIDQAELMLAREEVPVVRDVLQDLDGLVKRRLGSRHSKARKLADMLSDVAPDQDEGDSGIPELMVALSEHEQKGDVDGIVFAKLRLASALNRAGDPQRAARLYLEAVEAAIQNQRNDLLADAHRARADFFVQIGRKGEAEQCLRQAAAAATKSEDEQCLGRSLMALGIFLQHQELGSEAKHLLTRALTLLEPTHADALETRRHLTAIERQSDCGCEDQTTGLGVACRDFLLQHLPEHWVQDVTVRFSVDGDYHVTYQSVGALSEEQRGQVSQSIQQALDQFRKQREALD